MGKLNEVHYIRMRQIALDKYYENPTYCKYCKKMLTVGPEEEIWAVKKQQFCSRSCSGQFNRDNGAYKNNRVPEEGAWKGCRISCEKQRAAALERYKKVAPVCQLCGKVIEKAPTDNYANALKRKYCSQTCMWKAKEGVRKPGLESAVMSKPKSVVARTLICDYAKRVFYDANKKPKCARCGYAGPLEVAHIRAVVDFPPDTLVLEINKLDNLIGLCPTCHNEFDLGMWTIESLENTR